MQTFRALPLVILFFALLTLAGCGKEQSVSAGAPPSMAAMPAVPVSVAKVEQQSVPTELHVIGTVEASAIIQVKSQVGGQLERVAFAEGQTVKKGDLLFVIDPRPYQEAVRQAEAAVNRDRAQIAQSEASLARDNAQAKFAETDAALYQEMHKEGLGSKQQSDQSSANAAVARAAAHATAATIASARAALEADQAAVAAAKLNLSYCEIHAPITGRTGNLLVQAGNLIKANDVPIVVIHQVSPIFVNFSVPEQHLAAIRRLNAARPLAVRVFTSDNPDRIAQGRLAVIDNAVDANTGTIHLKAAFDNADGMLWPGQFVTAVLTLDTIQNAAVAPAAAVQNGQQGQFVYVVNAANKVDLRPVTVGRNFGTRVVIDKGVAPGDTVVIDGQLRLFPGAPVRTVTSPAAETERP